MLTSRRVAKAQEDFRSFAMQVAGGSIMEYERLMRQPLTVFTLACEKYFEKLIAAKKQRDRVNKMRTLRHGR